MSADAIQESSAVLQELTRLNPEALLLEPREFFDKAVVGWTEEPDDHWGQRKCPAVAVYDVDLCLSAIKEWLNCDDESAMDWFGYNTEGAWVGEGTPTFRWGDNWQEWRGDEE